MKPSTPSKKPDSSVTRNHLPLSQRVLLVDDDSDVRCSLHLMLERAGFAVASVPNGKVALARLEHETFAWLVTDIVMPDLDGFELLKSVRQSYPDMQIVAMSGGNRGFASHYLSVSRLLGATHQLRKPFAIDQLIGVLEAAYDAHGDT